MKKIKTKNDINKEFKKFASLVKDKNLVKTCSDLKKYPDFWTGPGGIKYHHAFHCGLIIHTLEVTENAIHIAKLYKNCNMDILITSALWHDLAKIWDYTWDYNSKTLKHEWMKADYHGKIHHITGSTAEFTAMALKNNVDRNIIQKIQHCIISHHGFNKDFGSPRIPESLEAVILHQADMLSAVHPKHAESPIKYT